MIGSKVLLILFTQNFRQFRSESNEKFVSVRSDRNIWDHLWRWCTLTGQTEIYRSVLTNWLAALLQFSSFSQMRSTGERNAKQKGPFLSAGSVKSENVVHFTTVRRSLLVRLVGLRKWKAPPVYADQQLISPYIIHIKSNRQERRMERIIKLGDHIIMMYR